MIDVSELFTDPDFAQTFAVIRFAGGFASEGEYAQAQVPPIAMVGVIQPANQDDVVQIAPEGERTGNWIAIYCTQEIRASDGKGQQSDIIVWHGNQYRIAQSRKWQDHGYWQALARGIQNA